MQVAARAGRVPVAGDTLEDMQFHAHVGHPGRGGMAEPVAYQAAQTELGYQRVPVRGVAEGGRRDCSSARASATVITSCHPSNWAHQRFNRSRSGPLI